MRCFELKAATHPNCLSPIYEIIFMSELIGCFLLSGFRRSPDVPIRLKTKQCCPNQGWILTQQQTSRQRIRIVGNRMPVVEPKWIAGDQFRVLCRLLLRSPLFRDDLRAYYRTSMYSRMHPWRLDLESQNCQSLTAFINPLLGFGCRGAFEWCETRQPEYFTGRHHA
jgi:hypothetical protein